MLKNNQKLLEKLDKEIKYLEEQEEFEDKRSSFLYEQKMDDIRDLFTKTYEIRDLKRKLEKNKQFLLAIDEKNIEINKSYFLNEDIYLSCSYYGQSFSCYFYMENTGWIYNSYIGSHSGINAWITNLVNEEYALFSGNSQYNYAFGCMDLKDFFKIVEDEKEKKDIKYRAECLEKLIEFTKVDGKFSKIRKTVVDSIEHKLQMMKESIGDE